MSAAVTVNCPRFERTPSIAREAWVYPQAQAYVGRLSTYRNHHRDGASNIPPAEAEARFHVQSTELAMVA